MGNTASVHPNARGHWRVSAAAALPAPAAEAKGKQTADEMSARAVNSNCDFAVSLAELMTKWTNERERAHFSQPSHCRVGQVALQTWGKKDLFLLLLGELSIPSVLSSRCLCCCRVSSSGEGGHQEHVAGLEEGTIILLGGKVIFGPIAGLCLEKVVERTPVPLGGFP